MGRQVGWQLPLVIGGLLWWLRVNVQVRVLSLL